MIYHIFNEGSSLIIKKKNNKKKKKRTTVQEGWVATWGVCGAK